MLQSTQFWVCALSLLWTSSLWAGEATATDFTPEKIKELVLQLGDDSYDVRIKAEVELIQAGVKAKDALDAACKSKDAQIAATAKRLAGKLKLATLGAIDYFDVLPEKSFFVARVTHIGETLKNAQTTALGKILSAQLLSPDRLTLISKVFGGSDKESDAHKKFALLMKHCRGQAALAVWDMNAMEGMPKAALLLEVTDCDAAIVSTALFEIGNLDFSTVLYKEAELKVNPEGETFVCLGKHLLFAPSVESAHEVIDNLMTNEPQGFKKSALLTKTMESLPAKNEVYLALDAFSFLKEAKEMIPGLDEMFKTSSFGGCQWLAYASTIQGDGFEDRFVAIVDNSALPKVPTNVSMLLPNALPADLPSLVPVNASVALFRNIDCSKLLTRLKDYSAAYTKALGEEHEKDVFTAVSEELETKWGVKVLEILSVVKGPMAGWVVLSPNGLSEPPSLGVMLTCPGEAKTKSTVEATVQFINKTAGKEALKTVVWKTHTLYQIDLHVLNENFPATHPYGSPCFALEGKRVYIASSSQALQLQLGNIDNKVPGLLSNPDFVKATAHLKDEDRKDSLVYADLKTLLTQGGAVGLPLLTAAVSDEGLKKFLSTLPTSKELFKDLPPLTITSSTQYDKFSIMIRAPLPPVPVLLGGYIGTIMMEEPDEEIPDE